MQTRAGPGCLRLRAACPMALRPPSTHLLARGRSGATRAPCYHTLLLLSFNSIGRTSFSGLKKSTSEKSRAARARKLHGPTPLKSDFFSKTTQTGSQKMKAPPKWTHSTPDLLSRDEVCARNLRCVVARKKESRNLRSHTSNESLVRAKGGGFIQYVVCLSFSVCVAMLSRWYRPRPRRQSSPSAPSASLEYIIASF